jgi:hypothetical protein
MGMKYGFLTRFRCEKTFVGKNEGNPFGFWAETKKFQIHKKIVYNIVLSNRASILAS